MLVLRVRFNDFVNFAGIGVGLFHVRLMLVAVFRVEHHFRCVSGLLCTAQCCGYLLVVGLCVVDHQSNYLYGF